MIIVIGGVYDSHATFNVCMIGGEEEGKFKLEIRKSRHSFNE